MENTEAGAVALNASYDMVLLCNHSVVTDGGVAVDELLAGLTHARWSIKWLPGVASEQRPMKLLSQEPAASSDALKLQPQCMRVLDLLV